MPDGGLGSRASMGLSVSPDNASGMMYPSILKNKLPVNGSKGNLTLIGTPYVNIMSGAISTGSFNWTNGFPVRNPNSSNVMPLGNDFGYLGESGLGLSSGNLGEPGMANIYLMHSTLKGGDQMNPNVAMHQSMQTDPLNSLPSSVVEALTRTVDMNLTEAGSVPGGIGNNMNMTKKGMM